MDSKELKPLNNRNAAALDIPEDGDNAWHSTRETRCKSKAKKIFKDNAFMILTIIGVTAGFLLGFTIRLFKLSPEVIKWLQLPGDIFVRLLTLTILPLIVGSLVVVTSKLDPKANGKISIISFAFIVIANVVSALIGLFSALLIRPGFFSSLPKNLTIASDTQPSGKMLTTSDVFMDLLMNIFPDNIVAACLFKTQTKYQKKFDNAVMTLINVVNQSTIGNNSFLDPGTDSTVLEQAQILEERVVSQTYAMNMIGILFISCVFGISARLCGEKAKPFLDFFDSVTEVVTVVMRGFLWLTPAGVCFMILGAVSAVENMVDTFTSLGLFIVTVTAGLVVHFILINVVLFIVSRKNPFAFLKYTFNSWFISFATTVPVIAIPEMYDCCDKFGINYELSRVVIPFAAAMKGDGPAVFIAAASVFVAQLANYELNVANQVIIALLTSSAAMALPNIPSGGIIIVITILNSIGSPVQAAALLFAVDWWLDRLRSGNMGISHCYCAAFTFFLCTDGKRRRPADRDRNDPLKKDTDVNHIRKSKTSLNEICQEDEQELV